MVLPGVPSFGDIVTAIKILNDIIEAFSGAKQQYAVSCGFLRQLVPVLRRMQAQRAAAHGQELESDVAAQHEAIGAAYEEFDRYLSKKYHGLSAKDPSKAQEILLRAMWSLDELDDRVEKLRGRMSAVLQPYQTLMLQELNSKVINIAEDFQGTAATREQGDKRFKEVQATLKEIQVLHQVLHEECLGYKLAVVEQKQSQTEDTAAIRDDIADMKSGIKTDIKSAQQAHAVAAQAQLQRIENKLLALIREQRDQADSLAEAARWEKMKDQAERQVKDQIAQQQETQKQLQHRMQDAANLLRSTERLTNYSQFGLVAEKAECLGVIVLGVIKLGYWVDRRVRMIQQPAQPKRPYGAIPLARMPAATKEQVG